MRLHTMTVTGADDQVDPAALVALSTEYPFVEWGLLLTLRQGRPLFPSASWLASLFAMAPPAVKLSGHICNTWSKEICQGRWPAEVDGSCFRRIQLNIAKQLAEVQSARALAACLPRGPEVILQVGTARRQGLALAEQLRDQGVAVSVLFDASGGKGRSPKSWPSLPVDISSGFAGGLGPDNLEAQLERLKQMVGGRSIWIDMQSRVRSYPGADADTATSPPGSYLDLGKVRLCLEIAWRYASAETASADPASGDVSQVE
jgi:hypothetical protein